MTLKSIQGLHHFTALTGDPTENAKFYVNTLGLRMVKKTVNHDAPEIYHLFYGDNEGTPGSSITFFPQMSNIEGQPGANMVTELGLRIPENSLQYWIQRLQQKNISFDQEDWNQKTSLKFEDNEGLQLRLVPSKSEEFKSWSDSKVPEKHQLQGMSHVTLSVQKSENTVKLLQKMGLKETFKDFFEAEDGSGVKIHETNEQGRMGKGSVHHVAFKAGNEENQSNWREKIQSFGLRPSPTISRKYFTSFYFREFSGILFEFSTMGPGYTADETVEELGTSLVLPEKLESQREQIEKALPEFNEDEIQ